MAMREMPVEEFVRRLRAAMDNDHSHAFFLGAGCSRSSGILLAGELVQLWLPRLKKIETDDDSGHEAWAANVFPGYEPTKAAGFYGPVMERLFHTAQERQAEIEDIVTGKDPGFGYGALARLISHNKFGRNFNVVLTTNFDDMVADALYLYGRSKPLVISLDSLAGFVRATVRRPLVVKLHGDARLERRNTQEETADLPAQTTKALRTLLHDRGLVFVGYGGGDKSIANFLSEMPPAALPGQVYWVNEREPGPRLLQWLKTRRATWVKHRDFDHLMYLMLDAFALGYPELEIPHARLGSAAQPAPPAYKIASNHDPTTGWHYVVDKTIGSSA